MTFVNKLALELYTKITNLQNRLDVVGGIKSLNN